MSEMAIEVLKRDMRCSQCGALLKKGTKAKVYKRKDGTVLVYGFNCHQREEPTETVESSNDILTPLLDALADIRQTLHKILDALKGSSGVPTEQVIEELEQEAQEQGTPLEASDWRRFWATVKRLGFDAQSLHEIYQCDSLKDIIKTKEKMEEVLEELRKMAF